ncbi:MAG: YggS family pyridoxal phosphate-dependent enzyme [Oscillospiraceae bacterium]|jgi:pyridoxal phosphate enzyme (YggS family)|nr:YggS family pyridoxal phosphate-dependent enzyme [Oscillospiraceae bacterium]
MTLRERYGRVLERVREAEFHAHGSTGTVRLMAVTKTIEEPVIAGAIEAGARLLGENRVQELARKRGALDLTGCELHLIGHLQSNKAARAVACADMVQSVDSVRIAGEISRECVRQNRQMPVLLEVNIGRDPAKFGFLPEETEGALAEIAAFSGISVRGLMTVPPFSEEKSQAGKFFSQMYRLFLDIRGKKMDNITMDILSMGMSGDFESAIAEGSNLVRVGSAIFGDRNYC